MSLKVVQTDSSFQIQLAPRQQGQKNTVVFGIDINGKYSVPNGTVTKAMMAIFVSAEQTGTGSSQNIAHGLGVVPTAVFVAPTDTSPATVGVYTVTEGTHDATNVKVTVTLSKKFKVLCFG